MQEQWHKILIALARLVRNEYKYYAMIELMKVPPYHTLPYHILHTKEVMGSQKDELQYPFILPHTTNTHTSTTHKDSIKNKIP